MDVDRHGRLGHVGFVDVDLLDFGAAISDAHRRCNDAPRLGGQGLTTTGQYLLVGRPISLVVGGVERLLVHVAPNQRAFGADVLRHGHDDLIGGREKSGTSGARRREEIADAIEPHQEIGAGADHMFGGEFGRGTFVAGDDRAQNAGMFVPRAGLTGRIAR